MREPFLIETVSPGKLNSAKGFANESRLLAALLERGFNAALVDLPHSTYDLVMEVSANELLRIQVKTVGSKNQVSFRGGTRGGVDRTYRSDVKSYVQSSETSDVVVGVRSKRNNGDTSIDYYVIPTLYIEHLAQASLSVRKIPQACNNWELLVRCKEAEHVREVFGF